MRNASQGMNLTQTDVILSCAISLRIQSINLASLYRPNLKFVRIPEFELSNVNIYHNISYEFKYLCLTIYFAYQFFYVKESHCFTLPAFVLPIIIWSYTIISYLVAAARL